MPEAHLVSIDALRAFSQGIRVVGDHFGAESANMREAVLQHIARARTNVESRESDLDDALEALRYADEEDDSYEREAVEEARTALQRARNRLDQTEAAASWFLGVLSSETAKLEGALATGRAFVESRIDTATHYRSITNDSATGADGGAATHGHSRPAPAVLVQPSPSAELPSSNALPPLPRKMRWVPIDDIDHESIPDSLDFNKASSENMRKMMQTFEQTVVSSLRQDLALTSDDLLGANANTAEAMAESPRFAYECMLGSFGTSDVIAVESIGINGRTKHKITSGRHRIKIAKELGWTHVPARVLGERSA